MLAMIISLLVLLKIWEFSRRAGRLFHSLSSRSQRFLSLVQPNLAMAHPSLRSLTLRGLHDVLVMRGLPKMDCLSTFMWVAGSRCTTFALMFSQVPKMLL
jgi:hypothetical protein